MALIGTIAINMKVNAKALNAGFTGVRKNLGYLVSSITGVQLGLAGIGIAASAGFYKAVTSASNLEEQTDRVRDQFGKASQKVVDFASTIGTAFGIAKTQTLESAASFAAIFQGAGYADEAVADLSIHFVKMGTDISRFVNMKPEAALLKLKSGLAGESEAIRQLGVSMLESDVSAYAYAHGIAKLNAELTSSQKIQARVGYLTERFQIAQGNLAKTGDKYAGSVEALGGRLENLAATIGDTLLHLAVPAESQIAIQAFETAWIRVGDAALRSSSTTVEGLTAVNHSIGPIQRTIGFMADAWQGVGESVKIVQVIVAGAIKAMIDGFKSVNDTYVVLANLLPGKKIQTSHALEFEAENAAGFLSKSVAELKELQKQPWAHIQVNLDFDQARKDIQAARDKLLKAGNLDVSKIKPTNAPLSTKGHEHKGFAPAAVFGEPEAANAILQARFGMPGGKNGAVEQTAKNTNKANVWLEQIARKLGVPQGAAAALVDAF